MRSFFLASDPQSHLNNVQENGDIPHAAKYEMWPEAWWNKPDWLKIWLLQSDPHSVMPLIRVITGVSGVPSLNYTHPDTHTNLVLLIETAFSLLSLCGVSVQLVEPHFELPQFLSVLSLRGRDGGAEGWPRGGGMDVEKCKEKMKNKCWACKKMGKE